MGGRRIRITHLTHDMGKTHSTHEESVISGFDEPKPTFKTKIRAHLKRFWWLHLIIFVVGFLATTFPMFGYPCHSFRLQADKNDATVSTSFIPSSPKTLSMTRKSRSTLYTSRIQRLMVFNLRSTPHFPPTLCTRQTLMPLMHLCTCQIAIYPSSRSRSQAPHRALTQN